MDQMRGRVSKTEYNALSVRLELQADCFAGVWAHNAQNARQILEQGDVEEAMSEMALASSRKARLTAMVESGDKGAHSALGLLDNPTQFLSSVQVGITSIGMTASPASPSCSRSTIPTSTTASGPRP